MPPHIKQCKDRGSVWHLIDGDLTKSLETTKKGLAQHRLEQYFQGKYGLKPTPTVGKFFSQWIEKIEPLCRKSRLRDYRQHFRKYILPRFKDIRLLAVGVGELRAFQVELLRRGLSVKTVRNIMDGSFRALYRDARGEIEALQGRDPFLDIRWERARRQKPDSFTMEEETKILDFFRKREPCYYPFVFLAFKVGLRPSEAVGLLRSDVNVERCEISITKSRHLGVDGRPKTAKSKRTIRVPAEVIEVLLTSPSFAIGAERVFLNKHSGPLDANQWASDYWARVLKGCGIRHRSSIILAIHSSPNR